MGINKTIGESWMDKCLQCDYSIRDTGMVCYLWPPRHNIQYNWNHLVKFWKCFFGCEQIRIFSSDHDQVGRSYSYCKPSPPVGLTATPTSNIDTDSNNNDELLKFIAFYILLPIVLVLIMVCFVLGVVLVVKTYMLTPLRQNLITQISRRRNTGHAPDNNYIQPAEMRSTVRLSSSSDRKSLPPPEVLMAARARASQMLMV